MYGNSQKFIELGRIVANGKYDVVVCGLIKKALRKFE